MAALVALIEEFARAVFCNETDPGPQSKEGA